MNNNNTTSTNNDNPSQLIRRMYKPVNGTELKVILANSILNNISVSEEKVTSLIEGLSLMTHITYPNAKWEVLCGPNAQGSIILAIKLHFSHSDGRGTQNAVILDKLPSYSGIATLLKNGNISISSHISNTPDRERRENSLPVPMIALTPDGQRITTMVKEGDIPKVNTNSGKNNNEVAQNRPASGVPSHNKPNNPNLKGGNR